MELEHSYINTNGIRLRVVQAGPKSGIPVILLHGFPEFWYGWRKQIPALVKAGCRVIVPDQRGYNLSDKPKDKKDYDVFTLVDDVLGLIKALDYEKVNLVGHDWGAVVAWTLAVTHPEKLHKLTVMNVPHPAVMQKFLRRDFEQMRRSWYVGFFQIPWLPEKIFTTNNFRRLARAVQGSAKKNSYTDADMEKYKEAWSQPDAITSMLNWYRAIVQHPPQLPEDVRVKVRALMMWGMKDFALSHRMARPSMDYCDEGNLILFPEATHWVHLDAADEVNHYLIDFLLDSITKRAIK
ncbi:MAG TPA: alpha/beta hydrolase [Anaerolineales bacterium]|jgi:pimeloyl-ACP methyl ester carboxylesterase|nr:alpha/beta hydrolase [Anaerolineales bacterium]